MSVWDDLRRPGARSIQVDGAELRRGSRVRLRPSGRGGDVFDDALAGRVAVVASLETDVGGAVQLAVTLEDDPGRDLGEARQPGHRFFFAPEEVEPLPGGPPPPRVLVAGIGNAFLGDDGFGVALARRLLDRPLPDGVEVKDFGIRGVELAYALQDYDAVLLLDALPRGEQPGTLTVVEPNGDGGARGLDAHAMDPVRVLAFARELGRMPERVLVLGCEPLTRMTGEEDEIVGELSGPVLAAVAAGVPLAEELIDDLIQEEHP